MKRKKGFTLIEIVIALAVIAIMMAPLASSLLTSVKANKKAEIAQESKLISQEIIEKLRTLGDVKEIEFSIGNKSEKLSITKDATSAKNFNVNGVIDGINVTGTIKKTAKGGNIQYESDEYLKEKAEIVFYCYTTTKTDGSKEDKIKVSYAKSGIEIQEHIKKIEQGTGTIDDSKKIIDLANNRKIEFEFFEKGKCDKKKTGVTTHDDCNFVIKDSSASCFNLEDIEYDKHKPLSMNKIAIIVRDHRLVENTEEIDKSNLIGLEIKNKRESVSSPEPLILFFNNRFAPINDKGFEGYNPIKDSFDLDKSIDTKIKVVDNIKYTKVIDMNNKGLYTISLKTEKNGTIENTVSEFIVSD